jgi:hypothetical protein
MPVAITREIVAGRLPSRRKDAGLLAVAAEPPVAVLDRAFRGSRRD